MAEIMISSIMSLMYKKLPNKKKTKHFKIMSTKKCMHIKIMIKLLGTPKSTYKQDFAFIEPSKQHMEILLPI